MTHGEMPQELWNAIWKILDRFDEQTAGETRLPIIAAAAKWEITEEELVSRGILPAARKGAKA